MPARMTAVSGEPERYINYINRSFRYTHKMIMVISFDTFPIR